MRVSRKRAGKGRERGVALLVVVSTLTLVGSVVAQLQFDTRVDLELAMGARDDVQAEYNALSALRVRALLLKNARQLDGLRGELGRSLGVEASLLPSLTQLLELVPIECGMLAAIAKVSSAEDDDAGFMRGDCAAVGASEHAKISLSALASPRPADAAQAQQLLLGVLSDPKLARFFERDDEAGSHAESPQELVGAIVDWMDTNKQQFGTQIGDEDRYYVYLKDPYRTKNAPFDSVAELSLVHGVSDELYEALRSRVTVYNTSSQIELGTADDMTVGFGVCSVLGNVGDCATLLSSQAFWTGLQQLRTAGGGVAAPLKVAGLQALLDGMAVAYDASKLRQVFSDRSSTTWYTIDATGEFGNAHRRVSVVYQTQESQYYYYRIE